MASSESRSDRAARLFREWKAAEETAERCIPLIGHLYRHNNVVAILFGQSLMNCPALELLEMHKDSVQFVDTGVPITDTLAILEALGELDLGPCKVDVGLLARGARENLGVTAEAAEKTALDRYLRDKLAICVGKASGATLIDKPRDVVLYGFGRIGRLLARILIEKTGGGDKLRLRAIVVRPTKGDPNQILEKRASLLQRDSVHGLFRGTVECDFENHALVINGNLVLLINAPNPESVDYTQYGIDDAILIDNTGAWRNSAGLSKHLEAKGVAKVILTAPASGSDIKDIVAGVNEHVIEQSDRILAAASCTTNAVVPVLKVLNDRFGIQHGHVETVHSYTNDQNLIDNYHSKARRGRAAPLNMVITETGASKAIARALPELAGKFTGNSIRVPTPNVSLAMLILKLDKETTRDEINSYLRECSLTGGLHRQIGYDMSPEVVSSDFVGSNSSGVVDGQATIVQGDRVNLYVWYDNEYGYSCQVIRLTQSLGGIKHPHLP